jgi:Flp pilus assembly protein CpaB
MSAVRWVVLIVLILSIVALVAFARGGGEGEQRDRTAQAPSTYWYEVGVEHR